MFSCLLNSCATKLDISSITLCTGAVDRNRSMSTLRRFDLHPIHPLVTARRAWLQMLRARAIERTPSSADELGVWRVERTRRANDIAYFTLGTTLILAGIFSSDPRSLALTSLIIALVFYVLDRFVVFPSSNQVFFSPTGFAVMAAVLLLTPLWAALAMWLPALPPRATVVMHRERFAALGMTVTVGMATWLADVVSAHQVPSSATAYQALTNLAPLPSWFASVVLATLVVLWVERASAWTAVMAQVRELAAVPMMLLDLPLGYQSAVGVGLYAPVLLALVPIGDPLAWVALSALVFLSMRWVAYSNMQYAERQRNVVQHSTERIDTLNNLHSLVRKDMVLMHSTLLFEPLVRLAGIINSASAPLSATWVSHRSALDGLIADTRTALYDHMRRTAAPDLVLTFRLIAGLHPSIEVVFEHDPDLPVIDGILSQMIILSFSQALLDSASRPGTSQVRVFLHLDEDDQLVLRMLDDSLLDTPTRPVTADLLSTPAGKAAGVLTHHGRTPDGYLTEIIVPSCTIPTSSADRSAPAAYSNSAHPDRPAQNFTGLLRSSALAVALTGVLTAAAVFMLASTPWAEPTLTTAALSCVLAMLVSASFAVWLTFHRAQPRWIVTLSLFSAGVLLASPWCALSLMCTVPIFMSLPSMRTRASMVTLMVSLATLSVLLGTLSAASFPLHALLWALACLVGSSVAARIIGDHERLSLDVLGTTLAAAALVVAAAGDDIILLILPALTWTAVASVDVLNKLDQLSRSIESRAEDLAENLSHALGEFDRQSSALSLQVHDQLLQMLGAASMYAAALDVPQEQDWSRQRDILSQALTSAVRQSSSSLLDVDNLAGWLDEQASLVCSEPPQINAQELDLIFGLPDDSRSAVMTVVSEAVRNSAQHSSSPVIDIWASTSSCPDHHIDAMCMLHVRIRDYGTGLLASSLARDGVVGHAGVPLMRWVARQAGMALQIVSQPRGSLVSLTVPFGACSTHFLTSP